jgi:hypothetical protein
MSEVPVSQVSPVTNTSLQEGWCEYCSLSSLTKSQDFLKAREHMLACRKRYPPLFRPYSEILKMELSMIPMLFVVWGDFPLLKNKPG